jgi:murein L,D-transpeptidase YcbB/YkuD
MFRGIVVHAFLVVLATVATPAAATSTERSAIMRRLDAYAYTAPGVLAAPDFLQAAYARRDFEPLWRDHDRANQLLAVLASATEHGLDPAHYHLARLRSRLEERRGAAEAVADADADLEVLLSEALARFAYHLRFGKVDPESRDPSWEVERSTEGLDPVGNFLALATAPALHEALRERLPDVHFYARLQAALSRYRAIEAAGGWATLADGPALKLGGADPRSPVLRRRLATTGDLQAAAVTADERFDAALEDAVKRFQRRHGLEADGVVGRRTREALNVSAGERVAQIRVNLERARWYMWDLEPEFLAVDIAGFEATLFNSSAPPWRARIVVGQPYRMTPVFKGRMTYLVLNPTWTVPPGILNKDIIPRALRDPGYIAHKGFQVLDSAGRPVALRNIDWDGVRQRGFPYVLRQPPGPENALGRVKFMFPNKHLVYVHDTPNRELFERTERTFSSGCIRIENPLDLAALLLRDQPEWDRARIDAVVASGETTTVKLRRPLSVMLLYWTAWVTEDGEVRFRPDIYGRDAAVLGALDAPFHFVASHG